MPLGSNDDQKSSHCWTNVSFCGFAPRHSNFTLRLYQQELGRPSGPADTRCFRVALRAGARSQSPPASHRRALAGLGPDIAAVPGGW